MALGLAALHEVTVATRANNRAVIERFLQDHRGPRPSFLYVDPPPWVVRLKKSGVLPVQVFYACWQWQLARVLQQAGAGGYDIVHQLTFNSFEVPPFAFLKSRAVKVWGPVGGGQTVRLGLLAAFSRVGAVKEWLRNLRVKMSAVNPLCRKVLAQCALVLFANDETRHLLGGACTGETGLMIDVGVDVAKFAPARGSKAQAKTTILFAGRLAERKGALLLVEAFAKLAAKHCGLELRIVGDGPQRRQLADHVCRQGLAERVIFTGMMDHDEMRGEFARADIFAFPSLRDTSGAIVLEAMAMQLPVVCLDHQGAAIMVEAGCGLKVHATTRRELVAQLQIALELLVERPDLRQAMGLAARNHVALEYDWQAKVKRVSDFYKRLATTPGMTTKAHCNEI
jgi:glycosyltransferase involved in cell wall biosynthesis